MSASVYVQLKIYTKFIFVLESESNLEITIQFIVWKPTLPHIFLPQGDKKMQLMLGFQHSIQVNCVNYLWLD